MSQRFRVSRVMVRQLQELQVPLPAVLRTAGLPDGFFQQERILVTTEELFSLWDAVGTVSGDPAIGIRICGDTRIEAGTPQTIAALHSETFLDAVQRMGRYKQLTCPEEIRIHRSADEAAVEFVFLLGKEMEPFALVDGCFAWILTIGRRGTGQAISPVRLELTRSPAHREVLEKYFGCRVKFGAPRNALVFRPSDLDRPFITHNPEMLAMLGAQLEAELDAHHAQRSVGDEVKNALKRLLAGRRPAVGDVARSMGLSVRTLQRRLTEQGLSFQQLLQEARRDLAHHYLGQGKLELNETAYLLGFDDANSFFRAFQRWEGTSPHRWRTQHQLAAESV